MGKNDRTLEFWDNNSVITMARIDKSKRDFLSSAYTRAMMAFALWQPLPQRVFNLGLGAGLLAMAISKMWPDVIVDSAERDHMVPIVAADYFGFNRHMGNLLIGDGMGHLMDQDDGKYDAVLLDAYVMDASPPEHLWRGNFLRLVKAKMVPQGVVAMNVLDSSQDVGEIHGRLLDTFERVYETNVPGNVIFFATDAQVPRQKLRRRAAMLDRKGGGLYGFSGLSEHNLRKELAKAR